MLDLLLSPEVLMVVGPILLGALALLLKRWIPGADAMLKVGVQVAAAVVKAIAAATPNKVDDKVALALELLRDHYAKQGVELKPVDEAKAAALFREMHGVGK